jgi:hypothetical protein
MRSELHGPEKLLLASKKPRIQELIKLAETMTEEEIKNLPEKPDTIRGLLNIRREREQGAALLRAEAIADAMIAASQKTN